MDRYVDGFSFLDPGRLVDAELQLVLSTCYPADPIRKWVPMYRFEMRSAGLEQPLGLIDLRVGHTAYVERYAGHIGYRVEPAYRGHHYAARCCRLLFPLARLHGLNPLWITCDPDNIASRRTCELAGGRLMGIVKVPRDTELYRLGQCWKCRYRFDL
jgi:tagatose 1,6-diphosphate aldolase